MIATSGFGMGDRLLIGLILVPFTAFALIVMIGGRNSQRETSPLKAIPMSQKPQEAIIGDPHEIFQHFKLNQTAEVLVKLRPKSYGVANGEVQYFSGAPGTEPVLVIECPEVCENGKAVAIRGTARRVDDGKYRGGRINWYVRVRNGVVATPP